MSNDGVKYVYRISCKKILQNISLFQILLFILYFKCFLPESATYEHVPDRNNFCEKVWRIKLAPTLLLSSIDSHSFNTGRATQKGNERFASMNKLLLARNWNLIAGSLYFSERRNDTKVTLGKMTRRNRRDGLSNSILSSCYFQSRLVPQLSERCRTAWIASAAVIISARSKCTIICSFSAFSCTCTLKRDSKLLSFASWICNAVRKYDSRILL